MERRFHRLVAAAGVAALAFSACSSPHHGSVGAGATNPAVGTGSGAGTATTSLGPGTSSPPTAASRNTPTSVRSAGTTKPANPSSGPPVNTGSSPASGGNRVPAPAAPGTYTRNRVPAPAAPGTYTMAQSVTVSPNFGPPEPSQGTLVIDPAQPNGIQVDHRYVDQNPPANTTTQFLPTGPVILSLTEGAGGSSVSCTFNPPIAAPPWPPAVGKTFSSTGNCGSGTTVTIQGRIAGSQVATLRDGETFPVWVIDSTLNLNGQIKGSGTQVDWYSTALRLPVHEQSDVQGSYSGIPFTLHSVSDLVSSRPR